MSQNQRMAKRLTEEQIERIHRLREKGLSYSATARIIGCTPPTVRYHCKPEVKDEVKARATRWAKDNPERTSEKMREYRQAHKDRLPGVERAWRRRNQERVAQNVTKWQKANWEKVRCYKAKNRAARLAAPTDNHTPAQLREHLATFNGHCAYCLKAIPEGDLHIDHIEPLARGGAHALENLVPTCSKCNLAKHSKTLLELLHHAEAE